MPKKTIRLPPLSVNALNVVERAEHFVAEVVHGRWAGAPSNIDRITRALRTCALTSFKYQITYYGSLTGFSKEWLPAIQDQVIKPLVLIAPSNRAGITKELNRTLADWAEQEFLRPGKEEAIVQAIGSASAPPERRAVIEAFIARVLASGRKINRTDIWTVAGYKDATEFERYQRADERTRKAGENIFKNILALAPEEFIRRLDLKRK